MTIRKMTYNTWSDDLGVHVAKIGQDGVFFGQSFDNNLDAEAYMTSLSAQGLVQTIELSQCPSTLRAIAGAMIKATGKPYTCTVSGIKTEVVG